MFHRGRWAINVARRDITLERRGGMLSSRRRCVSMGSERDGLMADERRVKCHLMSASALGR